MIAFAFMVFLSSATTHFLHVFGKGHRCQLHAFCQGQVGVQSRCEFYHRNAVLDGKAQFHCQFATLGCDNPCPQ